MCVSKKPIPAASGMLTIRENQQNGFSHLTFQGVMTDGTWGQKQNCCGDVLELSVVEVWNAKVSLQLLSLHVHCAGLVEGKGTQSYIMFPGHNDTTTMCTEASSLCSDGLLSCAHDSI